jgi:hypothetical protein
MEPWEEVLREPVALPNGYLMESICETFAVHTFAAHTFAVHTFAAHRSEGSCLGGLDLARSKDGHCSGSTGFHLHNQIRCGTEPGAGQNRVWNQ